MSAAVCIFNSSFNTLPVFSTTFQLWGDNEPPAQAGSEVSVC